MGMPNTGFIRAEGVHVSTANGSDLIQLQRLDTSIGQYAPYLITATNLLTSTPGGYTPGAVLFANGAGDIAGDATNLSFDDSGFVLSTLNYNAGASGTAGSLSIFPATASKGKLLFSAANSAGNTTTTITNASQAGARTYTIPDAGASASFVMTAGTQTLTGTTTITTLNTTTLSVGASGTAGTLDIYPTTASTGKTEFLVASNAGNTTTTITNASQAGARTYTIPDAGASASFMMTQGAQTVVGVQTFSAIPIGTASVVPLCLATITAQAGAARIIFVAPYSGTITDGRAAIDGAITATDITIALRINTTAVTTGAMTLANSGSGFGTKASCAPSAANTFVAGDVINATITGGVGTVGGVINVYVTRTA